MTQHVLDLIDNVVAEHELLSADAMRWAPDAPDPTPAPGHLAIIDETHVWLASDVQAWADRLGVVLNEWQRRVLRDAFTPPFRRFVLDRTVPEEDTDGR